MAYLRFSEREERIPSSVIDAMTDDELISRIKEAGYQNVPALVRELMWRVDGDEEGIFAEYMEAEGPAKLHLIKKACIAWNLEIAPFTKDNDRFSMQDIYNYDTTWLTTLTDEELAAEINSLDSWDTGLIRDLIWRADDGENGLFDEYLFTEDFEPVIEKAADVLGVHIDGL